jgi:membrane protease YdiL (CAAX protease family)
VVRWRFGIGWCLVILFGLPVTGLVLGLIFGGSLHTTDVGSMLLKQLGSIAIAVVVINLWEETVWAGFFQTRLEARFPFVVAAALTALPFAGVHAPLLLLDDQVSPRSVLTGLAGLLVLGVAVRLMIGVFLRAAADSILAVGVLHQVFDASNNQGGVVESLLGRREPAHPGRSGRPHHRRGRDPVAPPPRRIRSTPAIRPRRHNPQVTRTRDKARP